MTARSIRRAAEHKARKEEARRNRLAAAAGANLDPSENVDSVPAASQPSSTPRHLANVANSRLSTGPRTAEGKGIASLNAVKTGLTGRTVLLPSDDAAVYEEHLREYRNAYQPQGLREGELVQSLADTQWRLRRIPSLEAAIYSLGTIEFGHQFEDSAAEERRGFVELDTYLKYEKQLRNLQLQESRLVRRFEKEMKELRALQADRRAHEEAQASPTVKTASAAQNGFEFSTAAAASFSPENGLDGVNGYSSNGETFTDARLS